MSTLKFRNGSSFVQITADMVGAAAASHTHNYAGASSSGGAAWSANKLNTNAGSSTTPVYFSSGVPVSCSYSLNKTVPSNAVFTDTNTHTVYKQSSQPSDSICYVWVKPSGIASDRPMVYFRSD